MRVGELARRLPCSLHAPWPSRPCQFLRAGRSRRPTWASRRRRRRWREGGREGPARRLTTPTRALPFFAGGTPTPRSRARRLSRSDVGVAHTTPLSHSPHELARRRHRFRRPHASVSKKQGRKRRMDGAGGRALSRSGERRGSGVNRAARQPHAAGGACNRGGRGGPCQFFCSFRVNDRISAL